MAFHAGYASVRSTPLDAWTFNRWWLALERFKLMQTEEGKKELRTGVGVQIALDLDEKALSGDYGTAAMRVQPPKVGLDPATQSTPWTDPRQTLALLADDDPRAVFLRAGGRLDASGNPILPHSP